MCVVSHTQGQPRPINVNTVNAIAGIANINIITVNSHIIIGTAPAYNRNNIIVMHTQVSICREIIKAGKGNDFLRISVISPFYV